MVIHLLGNSSASAGEVDRTSGLTIIPDDDGIGDDDADPVLLILD